MFQRLTVGCFRPKQYTRKHATVVPNCVSWISTNQSLSMTTDCQLTNQPTGAQLV